jgi:outer membrane autotransporter protein
MMQQRLKDKTKRKVKVKTLVIAVSAAVTAMASLANAQSALTQYPDTQTVTGTNIGFLIAGNLGVFLNEGTIQASNANPFSNSFTINSFVNTIAALIGSDAGAAFLNTGAIGTLNNSGAMGSLASRVVALDNQSYIGTLTNSGVLSGQSAVANESAGTIDTITNSSTIVGTGAGIENLYGGLINSIINTSAINAKTGIQNAGTIGVIGNSGVIGPTTGTVTQGTNGIENMVVIDTIYNYGTIIGATALDNQGTINLIDNNDTVAGQIAIHNDSDGTITTLTNEASGIISGGTVGIRNEGQIGTFSNAGLISAVTAVRNYFQATIAALVNSGTISGTTYGVSNVQGGLIDLAQNTMKITAPTAISNLGTINTLSNTGLITGSNVGLDNGVGGTIVTFQNGSSGIISSANDALKNGGTIESLQNFGTISATNIAIDNTYVIGTLVNESTGTIVSTDTAINNTSTITTLQNHGVILGKNLIGIWNNAGTIGLVTNDGIIAGGEAGIMNRNVVTGITSGAIHLAQIGTISNGGIIAAQTAIYNDGSIGTITNTGTIAGNIVNKAAIDLNIVGSTGASFGALQGCGVPGVILGATIPCIVGDSTGLVSSTLSNVHFTGNVLLNDNVDVGGSGTVTNSNGTLQLGTAITITGNYEQDASATLLLGAGSNVMAAGALTDSGYGRLVVSGIATINSGSAITLRRTASYPFAGGQRFVVVDAATSSGGASTDYNAGSLQYALVNASGVTAAGASVQSADGTRTDLVVSLTSTNSPGGTGPGAGRESSSGSTPIVAKPATTANAAASLNGLGDYSGIASVSLLNLYNAAQALDLGPSAVANQAGSQLSPVTQADTLRAAMAPTYETMRVIGTHIDTLRLGADVAQTGVSSGSAAPSNAMWGQAFGGHVSAEERDDVSGYSTNFGGLMMGADKAINDQWRAGGAFSYSSTGINSSDNTSGDTTRVNGYGLFGYASYVAPRWYANLMAGGVYQNYKQTRQIDFTGFSGTTNGSFGGSQLVARGEAGYPLALGAATLTPLASLSYAYMRQNGYTESGGNGAALSVDAAHATSVQSDLGAKIERAYTSHYGVLIPSVQVAWRHEYDHQKTSIAAQFAADPLGETRFTTQGATPVSDTAVLSAGLTLLRANNLSVTAQYTVQAGKGYVSQSGTVKLRQLF